MLHQQIVTDMLDALEETDATCCQKAGLGVPTLIEVIEPLARCEVCSNAIRQLIHLMCPCSQLSCCLPCISGQNQLPQLMHMVVGACVA